MPVEYLGGRRAGYGFGASGGSSGSSGGPQVNASFGSDSKSQTEEDLMKSEAELNRARVKDLEANTPEKKLEFEQKQYEANFRRNAERYIDSADLDVMEPHEVTAAIFQKGLQNAIMTAGAILATKERAEKAPLAGMPVETKPDAKSFSLLGFQEMSVPKPKVQANVPMSLPQTASASSMLDPRHTDDVYVPGIPQDYYKQVQNNLDKAFGPDPFPGLGSSAVKLKAAQAMAAQERAVRLQNISVTAANLAQKFIQQVLDVNSKPQGPSGPMQGPGGPAQTGPLGQTPTSQPGEAPTNGPGGPPTSQPAGSVTGPATMMSKGFNVEKLVGLYSNLKRKDLRNRGMMSSLAGTYDNVFANTSGTIMQVVAEDADYAKATGTTSLHPDPAKLLSGILKKLPILSNPEALAVLVDPVNTLQSDSIYADGYPRATVEVAGNALMDNLQTVASSLAKSKSKSTQAYATALNNAADKLRENLAILKGAPNSFLNEDAAVNMTQFVVDKALQTVAKNGPPKPGQSPFPVGVLSGLAKASYAGDRERAQKTLDKVLGKGWQPKSEFWDTIAIDPKDDEFLKEWMEYYIGDGQAPTDIDRFGLDHEATAQDRRKALNGLLGYPTGFFNESGGPLGLRAWSSRASRKHAENQSRLAEQSRKLNEKFTLPPVNPAQKPKTSKDAANGQNETNRRAASQPSA